jgi:hypothetical protein
MFNAGRSLDKDSFYFFTDRLTEDLSSRLPDTEREWQVLYVGKREALESELGFSLKLPKETMLFVLSIGTDRELYIIDQACTLTPLSVDNVAPVAFINENMQQIEQKKFVRFLFALQQKLAIFDVVRDFDYPEAIAL